MTVYVSDTPYYGRYFLWADTSDEAVICAYAVGVENPQRSEWHNSWECYLLDFEQFTDAIMLGATVTDRYGPALFCLERDGAHERLQRLREAHAAWLATRG